MRLPRRAVYTERSECAPRNDTKYLERLEVGAKGAKGFSIPVRYPDIIMDTYCIRSGFQRVHKRYLRKCGPGRPVLLPVAGEPAP